MDLLLTKPGGISTTEAAVKGLPMVLFDAVGGCETSNLEDFAEKGGALSGTGTDALYQCCRTLLQNPQTLAARSLRLRDCFPQNAAEIICKSVLGE